MAFRGHLDDMEQQEQTLIAQLNGMIGIMKTNGAKKIKPLPDAKPRYRRIEEEEQTNQPPALQDVLQMLGGQGTVIG